MKFGKQILAQRVPGWSQFYLDYKALKKIVSSLASGRSLTESPNFPLGSRPSNASVSSDVADVIPSVQDGAANLQDQQALEILNASGRDEDRGPNFQAHKTAFFFKLERELDKINAFYLQKEAELKLRLETLLSKRRAAVVRHLPQEGDATPKDHVEWKAVEEGFRLLERDLAKLQQFVDINATGFRKILKKWDKRSKSTTKELYLARQVDVQPVFDRQLIAELSDTVASCLLDLTDLTIGMSMEGSVVNEMVLTHQLALERSARMGPYHDLEKNLRNAVKVSDEQTLRELIQQSDGLRQQPDGKTHVLRILWKIIIEAPPHLADLIISTPTIPFDYQFIDDINGRTCLHEAAMSGELRLVNICIQNKCPTSRADLYGRTALHYAAMNGFAEICRRLLEANLSSATLDVDNYTPLMYALLNGNSDCVQVLLDDPSTIIEAPAASNDLIPLSIACRVGRASVVKLLLDHKAKCVPNTNGEYPIHIAAQEGHADICRLLYKYDGWDLPDKYNEWTPLFHAARHGHDACVKVLLDLGSNVSSVDETGKQAVFYAAWYGHPTCVRLLMEAASRLGPFAPRVRQSPHISPSAANIESDIDMIPSLSLPPPAMPYRVYGHNFLEKSNLVHVCIGHPFVNMSRRKTAVTLSPRLMGPSAAHRYPHSSPLFKLVMTCKPEIAPVPYTVSIPVRDEKDVFVLQTSSVDNMSLEFSVYPNFGTKTIGRAIALPAMLQNVHGVQELTIPILDHHLHMIGEVLLEVRIIKPFLSATLEIGGAVETYWKSLATPFSSSPMKPPTRMAQPFRTTGSLTSPSAYSASGVTNQTIILTSLVGDYIHLTVQLSLDSKLVVYDNWKLPVADFDLGVADASLSQLQGVAARAGFALDMRRQQSATPAEWQKRLRGSLITLLDILKHLPPTIGIYLEVASLSASSKSQKGLGRKNTHNLNEVVDAVLHTVYSTSAQSRRRMVFGSFNPDIAAALNWKQPNYPVFLMSECGLQPSATSMPTALTVTDVDDRRIGSIGAATDWAKMNNLLGVFLRSDLLTQVPPLIQGVKDAGLLVGAHGPRERVSLLNANSSSDTNFVDAYVQDGLVTFLDHSSRAIY